MHTHTHVHKHTYNHIQTQTCITCLPCMSVSVRGACVNSIIFFTALSASYVCLRNTSGSLPCPRSGATNLVGKENDEPGISGILAPLDLLVLLLEDPSVPASIEIAFAGQFSVECSLWSDSDALASWCLVLDDTPRLSLILGDVGLCESDFAPWMDALISLGPFSGVVSASCLSSSLFSSSIILRICARGKQALLN